MSDEEIKFVGGRLCLDFVNTADAWVSVAARAQKRDYADTAVREKLTDYGALARWSRLADSLSAAQTSQLNKLAGRRSSDAEAVLARALRLRRALYRILKSVVERWDPEGSDIGILHRELTVARKHELLVHEKGVFRLSWDAEPSALDRLLWPVVRSAVDFLTSDELGRLRQCKGDECGWMFLDQSRNHSRHWCDMRDCGNRDKVRRFRMRN